jgi:hypothetical protein
MLVSLAAMAKNTIIAVTHLNIDTLTLVKLFHPQHENVSIYFNILPHP